MQYLFGVILAAVAAFTTTNVDGFLLVILFFSALDSQLRTRHIVAGLYLGFGCLIAVSLVGSLGAALVPPAWIGLLGIMPIYLGIRGLVVGRSLEGEPALHVDGDQQSTRSLLVVVVTSLLSPATYRVAALTVANGGDNISVYIPLFAGMGISHLIVTIAVFFCLLAVWCVVGHSMARHPATASAIERYGSRFVPWVFIALGIWILARLGSLSAIAIAIGAAQR